MGIEIERKFLVRKELWQEYCYVKKLIGVHYKQGYLKASPECTIRLRIAGEKAFITIKGQQSGISRPEFEYAIPLAHAQDMFEGLVPVPFIEKIRYTFEYASKTWEVDEFLGSHKGLILAEIELENEQEDFAKPVWIAEDVSEDKNYSNSVLCMK